MVTSFDENNGEFQLSIRRVLGRLKLNMKMAVTSRKPRSMILMK